MADDPSWTPRQDMSLLCRVCANQHDYLIPIFEGEGLDHDMPNKMDKHLPIKVRENDKLPTQMCYQCASTIIAWSELVTNCLEADKKLSRMLKVNENKADTSAIADEDAGSDHYEDAYDDVGGGGDDENDDEDFEKEIKQLISDAGVKIVVPKAAKAKTTRASTRKRKSEAVPVKKENKKSKPDTSVSKSSTALIKPKEEVTSGEDRDKTQCQKKTSITRVNITSKEILEPSVVQMEQSEHDATNSLSVILLPELNLNKPNPKGRNFQCIKCHDIFDTNREMQDHLRKTHKIHLPDRFTFDCCFCSAVFHRRKEYHQHLTDDHDQTVSARHRFQLCACSDCGKMFYNSATLRMHVTAVHSKMTFECGPCGKTFRTKKYLREHIKRHTEKNRQQKPNSKRRTKSGELDKDKPVKCNLCGTGFDNNRQVAGHRMNCAFFLLKSHQDEKKADVTAVTLTSKEDKLIIMPKIGHHVVNRNSWNAINQTSKLGKSKGPPYICVHCEKSYTKKGSLYVHLSTKHGSKKREATQCEVCGKHVVHLAVHMRQVHVYPELRPHMCDLCGACFKKIGALRTHRVIHTGERYPCPVCGRGFTQRGDMRKHAKALHDVVLPTNSNETDNANIHQEEDPGIISSQACVQ